MPWLLNNYMVYQQAGRVVPGDTVSNVAWCTLYSGDVGTSRCELSTVAPSDAMFARCFDVLRIRLFGDLVFDFLCSCLVCIVRVFVGEQRRARRELRIQMDEVLGREGYASCR